MALYIGVAIGWIALVAYIVPQLIAVFIEERRERDRRHSVDSGRDHRGAVRERSHA